MKNDKRTMETKYFFNGKSKYYYTRPDFDKRCFKYLQEKLGLTKKDVIAELGAGTGKFTYKVSKQCGKVFAIEPNEEMFTIGKKICKNQKNIEYVKASAENTSLPEKSLDMALSVQSFHYFDKEKLLIELRRILKVDKYFCIIWNINEECDNPFNNDWSRLLEKQKLRVTGSKDNHNILEDRKMIFKQGKYEEVHFSRFVYMNFSKLKKYASSISFVPKKDEEGYDEFYENLKFIFDKNKKFNRVKITVTTYLQFGKIK